MLSLFFLFIILSLKEVVSSDVGFDLKGGEYIFQNHRVPVYDPFSYTASHHVYLDSHWLFQLVLFIIYSLSGVSGIILFKTLVLLATFVLIFRIGYKREYHIIFVIFSLLCFLIVNERSLVRSEIMTFLFLALYLYILHQYKYRRTKWVLLLPVLQMIWVNMHGLFVLGIVLLFIYDFSEFILAKIKLPYGWNDEYTITGKSYFNLCIITFLSIAACFITPYGYRGLFYSLYLFKEIGANAGLIVKNVTELMPPFSKYNPGAIQIISFYKLLILASISSFLLNFKRLRLSHLFIYCAFFYLSLLANRNIALFAIICMPIMAINTSEAFLRTAPFIHQPFDAPRPKGRGLLRVILSGAFYPALKGWAWRRRMYQRLKAVAKFSYAFFFIAFLSFAVFFSYHVISNKYYVQRGDTTRFGFGFSKLEFPEDAIGFIKENNICGPIFNTSKFGGYLIWKFYPDRKVFIDGRWEVYGEDFVHAYALSLSDYRIFSALVKRYHINCVLLENRLSLCSRLYKEKDWVLVYLDGLAAIFVKNAPINQNIINKYRLDLASLDQKLRGDLPSLPEDNKKAPIGVLAEQTISHLNKAYFFKEAGLYNLAQHEYEKALKSKLYLVEGYNGLGMVYLAKGEDKEAIASFNKAVKANPGFAFSYFNLGIVYAKLGMFDEAIKCFQKTVSIHYNIADAHWNLALIYNKKGESQKALKELKIAIALDPQYLGIYESIGDDYLSQKKFSEALAAYGKLSLKDYPHLYKKLAQVYIYLGNNIKAVELLKQYLKIYPKDTAATAALGSIYDMELKTAGPRNVRR